MPIPGHFLEGNQFGNGAHEFTQHTAQTFVLNQIRSAGFSIPFNCLTGGIPAYDVTLAATDAKPLLAADQPIVGSVALLNCRPVAMRVS